MTHLFGYSGLVKIVLCTLQGYLQGYLQGMVVEVYGADPSPQSWIADLNVSSDVASTAAAGRVFHRRAALGMKELW